MTREEINAVGSSDKFKEIKDKMTKKRVIKVGKTEMTVDEILKQYNPYQHDVNDITKRPDKILSEDGEEIHDAVNNTIRRTVDHAIVKVNRLPIPIQKRIVLIASTFLVGERINIESDAESEIDNKLEQLVRKVWKDNKLDYRSKEVAKLMKSETHCAELWYDYENADYWKGTIISESKKKFGVKVLAESKGDKLYPIFDEYDDLVAFGRGYDVTGEDGKKIEHFDIYTETKIIYGEKNEQEWTSKTIDNPFGAIPVIYYSQDAPEWADVQPLIDRMENRLSDFADTNDYFGDPALVANGNVTNMPDKAEVGKTFQVTNGGDVKYLTWDSAPESIKMEFDMLEQEINAGTHTPNISFDSMKNILGNTSGIALKLLFMDAQIKATDQQEAFGMLIQRRLNLLIKMVVSLAKGHFVNHTLSLYPIFKPYMPVNDVEYNNLLLSAYKGGMISKKTMVSKSTLVQDAEREMEEMDFEARSIKNIE